MAQKAVSAPRGQGQFCWSYADIFAGSSGATIDGRCSPSVGGPELPGVIYFNN